MGQVNHRWELPEPTHCMGGKRWRQHHTGCGNIPYANFCCTGVTYLEVTEEGAKSYVCFGS